MAKLRLISWNVNGIRAVMKKGFPDFLAEYKPDIIGLQEIKIANAAREKAELDFSDYQEFWNPAERPGYSGTATLVKNDLNVKSYQAGILEDKEGRVQTLEFDKFYFVNIYFPNANHELSRLDFKLKFNGDVLKYLKGLEKKKPVVVCGDFNVAHQEIDIARPKDNVGNAGFTAEERAWADKFQQVGFVDTFRHFHPKDQKYSWWSYKFYARDRNIGWRIDYFWVSPVLVQKIKKAYILSNVLGSDHCPVGIELNI